VGRRLGADLVIEGSVRKSGEHFRIIAQAIQTESVITCGLKPSVVN